MKIIAVSFERKFIFECNSSSKRVFYIPLNKQLILEKLSIFGGIKNGILENTVEIRRFILLDKNENRMKYEEKNMVSNESVAKSCFTQKPSVRNKRGHRNAWGVIDETAQYANNLKSNQTQPSTELYLEICSACASLLSFLGRNPLSGWIIFLTVPPMTSPVVGLPHESPSRRNAAWPSAPQPSSGDGICRLRTPPGWPAPPSRPSLRHLSRHYGPAAKLDYSLRVLLYSRNVSGKL